MLKKINIFMLSSVLTSCLLATDKNVAAALAKLDKILSIQADPPNKKKPRDTDVQKVLDQLNAEAHWQALVERAQRARLKKKRK